MRYTVELQPTAESDIARTYEHLRERARKGEIGRDYPDRWYDEVEDALYSLEEFPSRCPPAPEADRFRRPFRHLVLDNGYRIIFDIRTDTVWILHVRHPRRNLLDPQP